jgi:prepilin peptidase CpaA
MQSIAWWPSVAVLLIASAIDLRSRRVPNWLSLPFLAAGLLAGIFAGGKGSVLASLEGFAMALVLFGIPCLLGGMGMGDLKLAAGIGAWIGPGQLVMAFIMTGIVGFVLAIGYALAKGVLGQCLDRTGDLLAHFTKSPGKPHGEIRLGATNAVSIPYVPAIAIGTLFSFFAQ